MAEPGSRRKWLFGRREPAQKNFRLWIVRGQSCNGVDGAWIKEYSRRNEPFAAAVLLVGEKKSDKDALVSTAAEVYVLHLFTDD